MRRRSLRFPLFRAVSVAAALAVAVGPGYTAPVNWGGLNHGFWDVAGNWTPAGLPGLFDDVLLGAFDTELRTGTVNIHSVTGTGQLTLSGGSLQLADASSLGSLLFSGGTLTGVGALSVSGASTWTGGTMGGTGSTTFLDALTLSGSGQRTVSSRNVVFAGTSTWTNANGGGGFSTGTGATLTNSGTWLDATINGTSITNSQGGAASSFVNSGTYTKSGASNNTIAIAFNNSGTLNVNAGTLSLSGGGTSNGGAFNVAAGASVFLSGGTHALSNATSSGAGLLQINGATVNSSGTLNVAGMLGLSGGALNAGGAVTTAGLAMSGGTLGGAGVVTVSGPSTWSGGSMIDASTTSFNGALDLSGAGLHSVNSRSVIFAGTTTWANPSGGGGFSTGFAATLTNTGNWLDQTTNGTSISNSQGGAASTFVNTGTYTKSGVANNTFAIAFNNSGTLNVNGGTLSLSNGGTSTGGAFNVASGATLFLSGGTQTLSNVTVGGAGVLQVNGAAVNVNGPMSVVGTLGLSAGTINAGAATSVGSLAMSSGTLGGAGTITASGASTWSGGTMVDAGSTMFNGALDLSGTGQHSVNARSVTFAGTTTWANPSGGGSFTTGFGATLTNTGTWLDQTSNSITAFGNGLGGAASSFVNAGTYTKSGAANNSVGIAFNNNGTLNVNAGSLTLSGGGSSTGGAFNVGSAGTLSFSGGTYAMSDATIGGPGLLQVNGATLNTSGALNVAGTLGLSAGSINAAGNITTTSLAMSSGTLTGAGTIIATGASSWSGGTMSGASTSTFTGALDLNGTGQRSVNARTVNFAGTTTWTNPSGGGSFSTGTGATLNNSGTWLDQTVSSLNISNGQGGAAGSFVNTGTYTKSGIANNTFAIPFFNNGGTVNVNNGSLSFSTGGASNGGSFNVGSAGALSFSGGTYALNNGTTTGGDGLVQFNGATVNASGAVGMARLQMMAGTLGGTGAVAISGASIWSGGAMADAGSTSFNGALDLSGTAQRNVVARSVTFAGTSTWTNPGGSGGFSLGTGATLTNTGNWLDQTVNVVTGVSNGQGGAPGSFVNAGTYTKTGASFNTFTTAFNNPGTLNVNAGTLALALGGTSNGGLINVGAAGTLNFGGGIYTLNNVSGSGPGRMIATGGTVNSTGTLAFGGIVGANGGVFNINGSATAGGLALSAGTVGGTGALTLTGASSWTGGTMTDAGSTVFNGSLDLSGTSQHIVTGRSLTFAGTTSWTNPGGSGNISAGAGAALTNSGSFLDQTVNVVTISNGQGGAASSFVNSGSYTKSGATSTDISVAFSNSGTVAVNAGTLNLAGLFSNFSGTTLTGGSYQVAGTGILQFTGANIVTNAASLLLDGPGSVIRNSSNSANALANFSSNTAAGSFTIRNGRNFSAAAAFGNAGFVDVGTGSSFSTGGLLSNLAGAQFKLDGGSFASVAGGFNNAGSLSGYGSVGPVVANTGSVLASGGTLALASGVLGTSGAVTIDAGATLSLGANSSAGTLTHNGSLLALGSSNITISGDYANAGFGIGDSFQRHAGVSGSGLILAAGTTQQTLSGAWVQDGTGALATLALPNIRVGQGGVTASFAINNVGTGGPSLRGALQTAGVSNAALSGSGVTAQNWGAVPQGGSSALFSISFDPSVGQTLSGQSIQIVSNFDNVAAQTLLITGSAFNLAQASAVAPSPVTLPAQRVGGSLTQALTLQNIAPANGLSERLNASIAGTSGITASGSVNLLAPGVSSSALIVGVDTSTSGAKSGVATLTLASDGSGTSGFGALGIGSQTVAVSGHVYAPAVAQVNSPATLDFGIVRVGDVVAARNVSVSNTASGSLTDQLSATLSGGASPFSISGASALVAAGATDASSLSVQLNTSTAGVYSSAGSLAFASHNEEMADLALGSAGVSFAAQVNNLAAAAFGKTGGAGSFSGSGSSYVLNFGTITQGSGDQAMVLSVFNTAQGTADALAGSFAGLQPGSAFSLIAPANFYGVNAGGALTDLQIVFGSGSLGSFDQVLVLTALSTNASDPAGRLLGTVELHLEGTVVAVPEPGTWMLMAGGVLWLATFGRRRRAA